MQGECSPPCWQDDDEVAMRCDRPNVKVVVGRQDGRAAGRQGQGGKGAGAGVAGEGRDLGRKVRPQGPGAVAGGVVGVVARAEAAVGAVAVLVGAGVGHPLVCVCVCVCV